MEQTIVHASMPLKRSSHVSLYEQVAGQLDRDIAKRTYGPFEQLPSEKQLMELFGVSRITIRQAIDKLVDKGLVVRKQGKGTFVCGPSMAHELHELRGIYDTLAATGLPLSTKLLSFGEAEAPDYVRETLGGETFVRLKRLYILEDAPLALISTWFTGQVGALGREAAERQTVYGLLNAVSLDVNEAELSISAREAGRRLGKLLGCSARAPLLLLERTSYGQDRLAREHTEFFVRADRYRFTLSAKGPMPLSDGIRTMPERD